MFQSLLLLQYAGFSPKIGQEAQELNTIVSLVASGIGVALLPESIKFVQNENVIYLQLKKSATTLNTAVAWNENNVSPVVSSFLTFIKKSIIPTLK